MKIAIVTDSNSGITQKQAQELGVFVLAMPFQIDGETYYEDITLTQEEFYKKLREGGNISTSQPSPGSVTDLWDKILQEYESWGLCGEVKKIMGSWQYDDSDIERLSTIMTLHDIGFTNDEVEEYMRLLVEGASTEAKRMKRLETKRNGTLDEIHFKERQLDRLDYLRYEMKRGKNI